MRDAIVRRCPSDRRRHCCGVVAAVDNGDVVAAAVGDIDCIDARIDGDAVRVRPDGDGRNDEICCAVNHGECVVDVRGGRSVEIGDVNSICRFIDGDAARIRADRDVCSKHGIG